MTPDLATHLRDMQANALLVETLAETLRLIAARPEHRELTVTIIGAVTDVAQILNDGLDSENLPKEGAQ